MRFGISLLVFTSAICLGAAQAQAASCSSYAVVKSYDAAKSTVELDFEKGKTNSFFPRPSGTPTDTQKIPNPCKSKVTRKDSFAVKSTGGRLSITQIRSNFEGKMQNDADDEAWLGKELKKLIEAKTTVVVIIREEPGKKGAFGVTTIYLPITPEETKEIERIEAQAEDV